MPERSHARAGGSDSGFSSPMFIDPNGAVVSWTERAAEVHAEPFDRRHGVELFAKLWHEDRHLASLDAADLVRLGRYLRFAGVPANVQLIGQDEQGDYLLIVLDGTLAVDRVQPWGHRVRLAEAHAGEMLGEMAMLDAGSRFSACTTLCACTLAVLDAQALERMTAHEPRLAVALMAALSRRLSLRLRQVSGRLSAQPSRS